MNIAMIPHTGKPAAVKLGREAIAYLHSKPDVHVWLEHNTAVVMGYPELGRSLKDMPDLHVLLVLGGDGTLLNAARSMSEKQVPILGVNVGHLGFLTELESGDMMDSLDKLLAGGYAIEERMFIDVSVRRAGEDIASFRALNDMVITRGTFARIIQLSTYVDDQHVVDYHADGIIVATPTGSTAYSLSAGGPIVEPLLHCILVTPICPHTLASRSVVVRPEAVVELEVTANHEDVMLTIDGQEGFGLQSKDRVQIVQAHCMARFVKLRGRDFFAVLHSRLETPHV